MLFPIWVGLPFTITKSKGQTHWGSRSILLLIFNAIDILLVRLHYGRMNGSWAKSRYKNTLRQKNRSFRGGFTGGSGGEARLKKFLRERIEDLRLGTKIRENLYRFCLLRKDFVSKFDQVPTLNYYCYLYYFGSGKLYDWGQSQ
ncbi:hypothetical protein PHYBLDRAFT_187145 [Phycomyces blakesleeanus NRRL 1555(-)]|uniref:Uncharacterized protein n=1 Tax=Phycomyces blakesleeanus (strain ATCC 8743b / DSM 1359 / FGSC 10004 / NBRC 33097 / NRRL 1555) TaxID=763407 RepID=A0A162X5R5_PHYB8|nr:hypothetical protein PHYBLDRAFT_187145 [Phycomyces blakesleeanus NRRL 1555(-)]OAD72665.1 hypothetical protein PHYBLDRAFT_187145 [Phycomyces blakesleeanus NRRL 1555(-)]|eukprot:XP_018290705.1 hypothetical protein PHYBLDRAFT_187145 [Phycomyces blakesleeanus NRRL 1555(-)]